ncbi:uncharacterized protein [Triticum aestivum]|uniref:uncharacterized protein n=1 Tax=Triticum aestivum TaxID=4565 RepID=UPI0008424888|nr:uncharacterized protein LOC123115680 [Triticum aestivum]XP_044392725.1 uncharacterized protein LOC123115680 [Triticum aestivum]
MAARLQPEYGAQPCDGRWDDDDAITRRPRPERGAGTMMHANSLRAATATAVRAFSSAGDRARGPWWLRRLHCAGHRAPVREAACGGGATRDDVPRPRLRRGARGAEAGARAAPHRAAAGRHRREHHRGNGRKSLLPLFPKFLQADAVTHCWGMFCCFDCRPPRPQLRDPRISLSTFDPKNVIQPDTSLSRGQKSSLLVAYEVDAVGPILVIKHMRPFLKIGATLETGKGCSLVADMSASQSRLDRRQWSGRPAFV